MNEEAVVSLKASTMPEVLNSIQAKVPEFVADVLRANFFVLLAIAASYAGITWIIYRSLYSLNRQGRLPDDALNWSFPAGMFLFVAFFGFMAFFQFGLSDLEQKNAKIALIVLTLVPAYVIVTRYRCRTLKPGQVLLP